MRSDRLLQAAFDRARTGRPAVLSWLFRRVIPFNAPHGLRIAAVVLRLRFCPLPGGRASGDWPWPEFAPA